MHTPLPQFKVKSMYGARDAINSGKARHVISVYEVLSELNDAHCAEILQIRNADCEEIFAALDLTKRVWDIGGEVYFHCARGEYASPSFAFMMLLAYGCNPQESLENTFYVRAGREISGDSILMDLVAEGIPTDHPHVDVIKLFDGGLRKGAEAIGLNLMPR